MDKVYVVSVCLDKVMYKKCIADNPCVKSCNLVPFDNSSDNVSITIRYNAFIDGIGDEDAWIVFCHEDWKPLQPLFPLLQNAEKNILYGNIGIYLEEGRRCDRTVVFGKVVQSDKEGNNIHYTKGHSYEGTVDTFDCQCLIVHSSAIRKYGLRFDENLKFDMYVEDFCASACEKGLECRTLGIKAQHFSNGTLSKSFYESLEYVRQKYACSKKRYCSIAGSKSVFGRNPQKKVRIKHRPLLTRLRQAFEKD